MENRREALRELKLRVSYVEDQPCINISRVPGVVQPHQETYEATQAEGKYLLEVNPSLVDNHRPTATVLILGNILEREV